MIKQDKGITLIALIITIIVMMILVAVSVIVALNGGLFDTAKKAGSETQLKAEEEMLLSAVVGAIGTDAKVDLEKLKENLPEDFIINQEGVIVSPKGNEFAVTENGEVRKVIFIYREKIEGLGEGVTLVPYEELTGDLKAAADLGKISAVLKEIKDGIEMQAVIPADFEVSTEDGEDTLSGGLVVFDSIGNEFVWVPCTTDKSDITGLAIYNKDTRYNDGTLETKQYEYTSYTDWTDESVNLDSVSKYKGFYVGRYEAGVPSNAPFYASMDGEDYITEGRNTTAYIPVSKAGQPSWNYISQVNAKIVSEKMYSRSISVESGLIDSYAWDTIVNWMESENPGIVTDSTNYGNYANSGISITDGLYADYEYFSDKFQVVKFPDKYKKGDLEVATTERKVIYELATGITDKTKVLNIYDMAGNMWEFTTEFGYHNAETMADKYIVTRGGRFGLLGQHQSLSWRHGIVNPNLHDQWTGFRVVLYVK